MLPPGYCPKCAQPTYDSGVCYNRDCNLGSLRSPNEERRLAAARTAEQARRRAEEKKRKRAPAAAKAKKSGGGWKVVFFGLVGLFIYGAVSDEDARQPAPAPGAAPAAAASTARAAAPSSAASTAASAPAAANPSAPSARPSPATDLTPPPGSRQEEMAARGLYPHWGMCVLYQNRPAEADRIFRIKVSEPGRQASFDLLPGKALTVWLWENEGSGSRQVTVTAEDGREWVVPMQMHYLPHDQTVEDIGCDNDGYVLYGIPPTGDMIRIDPGQEVSPASAPSAPFKF